MQPQICSWENGSDLGTDNFAQRGEKHQTPAKMQGFSRTSSAPGTIESGAVQQRVDRVTQRQLSKKRYETAAQIVNIWQKQENTFSRTTSDPGVRSRHERVDGGRNTRKFDVPAKFSNSAADIVGFLNSERAKNQNELQPFVRSQSVDSAHQQQRMLDGNNRTSRVPQFAIPPVRRLHWSVAHLDAAQEPPDDQFRRTTSLPDPVLPSLAQKNPESQSQSDKRPPHILEARRRAKIRLGRAVHKAATESKLRKALKEVNEVVVELCETVGERIQPAPDEEERAAGKPRITKVQYKFQWAGKMIKSTTRLRNAMQALKDEVDSAFRAMEERRAQNGEHDSQDNPCDVSPRFIRRTLMSMAPHMGNIAGSEMNAVQHALSSLSTSVLTQKLSLDASVRGGLVHVVDLVDTLHKDDRRPEELFAPSIRSLSQMDTETFQTAVSEMAYYASKQPSIDVDKLKAQSHEAAERLTKALNPTADASRTSEPLSTQGE